MWLCCEMLNISLFSPPPAKELDAEFVSFDDLLKKSDFVILACPLTNETKNLMDAKAFEKMKSSSILVNISRGGENM